MRCYRTLSVKSGRGMRGKRATLSIVVAAVLTASLVSCGDGSLDLAAIRRAARPTASEKAWRQEALAANPEHPPVPGTVFASARNPLRRAVAAGGGQVVRLAFVWPAPDLVVVTTILPTTSN